MEKNLEYDVVVIGAGIAGLVSSVTANGLGQRVAIVEKRRFGGNCGSFTCLPSKTLIRAGHTARLLNQLEHFGLKNASPIDIDTTGLMPRVRSVLQKAYEKDAPETFQKVGISTIIGQAEFVDKHHIKVNDKVISSKIFIIATGTTPLVPPIPGLKDIHYLTNETLLDLNKLPPSMIIMGGGVDGLEFASAFEPLGVDVTIIDMSTRVLASQDRELVNLLLEQLTNEGIKILSGTKATSFSKDGERVVLNIEGPGGKPDKIQSDSVLLTIGRKPDTDGLKLKNAGVKYTPRGIITNDKMQTSTPNIYACGDIIGPYQLASMAEYQGIVAATNAILPLKRKADYSNAVFAIFTEPTLAYFGLTEEQARQKYGDDIKVYRFDYGQMRRALVDGTERGLAKFICDTNGKLLGVHILGESSGEVIHEAQMIKSFNKPLYAAQSVTHAYPTYAQALIGRASQLAFLDHAASNFFIRQFLAYVPGYRNRLVLAKQRLAETREYPALSKANEAIVNVTRLNDTVCLIELPTELSNPDEKPYIGTCISQLSGKTNFLILDFNPVQMMNGLGASMLVKLSTLAKRRNQRLLAFGVSDHYRDVLKVTGLDKVISIYSNRQEAFIATGDTQGDIFFPDTTKGMARDTEYWAKPVLRLSVPPMPPEAINKNMNGLNVVGPVDGFGQLWQKTYRLVINKPGLTPENIILTLKQNFPKFQPSYNRFYPTPKGILPGELVAIDSSTPGGPVSTGVMVLYSDEKSFTFITAQGHPESGWVTFSAFETDGKIVAQIVGLARANDPIYEAAFHTVGSKMQIKIWTHVLMSLATYLGVPADVTVEPLRVDPAIRWSQAGNIWYNAQVRTLFNMPSRLLKNLSKNPGRKKK